MKNGKYSIIFLKRSQRVNFHVTLFLILQVQQFLHKTAINKITIPFIACGTRTSVAHDSTFIVTQYFKNWNIRHLNCTLNLNLITMKSKLKIYKHTFNTISNYIYNELVNQF